MLEIPQEGAERVLCDNKAVFRNTSDPTLALKKKNQSNGYHLTTRQYEAALITI